MHLKPRRPVDVDQLELPGNPPPQQAGDRVRRPVAFQPLELVGVQIADEREPPVVGQRREQHVSLGRGDQRRPVARQPTAHSHVGRQRRPRVRVAAEHPSHRGTRDAVGTAGAEHVLRLDRLGPTVGSLQRHQDRVRARLHRGHRDPALEAHVEAGQPVGEDLLGAPLGQAALVLPATAGAGEPHLADLSQLRVEHPSKRQMHARTRAPRRAPRRAPGSRASRAAARSPAPPGGGGAAVRRSGGARRGGPAPRPQTAPRVRRPPPAHRPNPSAYADSTRDWSTVANGASVTVSVGGADSNREADVPARAEPPAPAVGRGPEHPRARDRNRRRAHLQGDHARRSDRCRPPARVDRRAGWSARRC